MKEKKILVIILTIAIVAIAMLGGNWSSSLAATVPTVPTIPREKPHKDNPKQPPQAAPTPTLGVTSTSVPVGPATSGNANFPGLGGADFPTGAACQDGVAVVYRVPVPFAPFRWLMWYYEDVLQVKFYVKGATDHNPPCGSFQVYYDLKPYERLVYDTTPDKIGIFFFDQGTSTWTDCKAAFQPAMADHGRLVCTANQWGYYGLGQIAPK